MTDAVHQDHAAYLDHAATTPVVPEVLDAVAEAMASVGNPSSLHAAGRLARRRVEESREELAALLDARPSEVIFTGGGTESDNLAVKGIFWARRAADARRDRVITSPAEHHAIIDTAEWLESHEDASLTWLPVEADGSVAVSSLVDALDPTDDDVAVISLMWANNEVGTVSPIAALAAVAREHGVAFHTDAVQALGSVPLSFAESGVDAMSVTGHKIGGPVGTGALLLRRDVPCTPLLHGGGQERDVRSGTVDVVGIIGFTVAARLAVARQAAQAARLASLRDRLVAGVLDRVPDAVLNGSPIDRLPGNAHLSFPDCEGDSLLMLLDAEGVQCSTGSACSAGVARASHVLTAMGVDDTLGRGSVRLSLGHSSTDADVDRLLAVIGPAVSRARSAGIQNRRGAA